MSAKKKYLNTTLFILVAAAALTKSAEIRAYQISGPKLGYVTDSVTSAVRVINGIPGASAIGGPVSLDVKVRRAQVSIQGDYAVAVSDDNGEVLVIDSLSGVTSVSPISGAVAGGDVIALSPGGSLAVTFSQAFSRIQIIEGLPSNPVVHFEVDTANMGQRLTAVAINENKQVLAAFSEGETGVLYLFAANTPPRWISTVGYVSSITFDAAGDRAVIADRWSNQVVLFENLSTASTPIQLAGEVDGISNPIAVLLSKDAKTAYVANQGSGTVTLVSLNGGEARNISCQCLPTAMRLLQGDSMFALTERTDEPIVVFVGDSIDPHFLIVPSEAR